MQTWTRLFQPITLALSALLAPGLAIAQTSDSASPPSNGLSFNRDIRPLLSDKCFHCHGPDTNHREADLRLDLPEAAHDYAIVAGDADDSDVYQRLTSDDPDVRMPPPESNKSLSKAEIELIRRWIDDGGEYAQHWAFIPPIRGPLPKVKQSDWVRNPIDAFVLARIERAGLAPSQAVDKNRLLRRVTLDLTGLPPTTAELDAFLGDHSPTAFERVVDRLLNSESYGERMAQLWLDAARYADTMGYQADWERYQWRWRSWVIDAYNRNLPFDQFTIEQLAGDLLPNPSVEQLIATGFNRNHRINDEGGIIPEEYLVEYIVDRVETTAGTWMGLTMGCARCHDHKFDPVSQVDFYRFFAYFNGVPEKGKEGRLGYADPYMRVARRGKQQAYESVKLRVAEKEQELKLLPEAKSAREELNVAKKSLEDFEKDHTTYVMVMREMDQPRETFVLSRGIYDQPGQQVTAGVPEEVLGRLPEGAPPNRLGLARWLVSGEHPLTARVIVNRYWSMLFGNGLVNTVEDFGLQGEYPSHPELLDWLATEYPRLGWDTKRLLKLIVMSATYQQASAVTPELTELDPANRLLARMSRVRMPAEMIRDQALSASGLMIRRIGGPSVKPYQPDGLWRDLSFQDKKRSTDFYELGSGDDLYRRSIYTFWKRSVPPPTMATFDAPSREMCTLRRSRTNTPLQALALMNDTTYVEASRTLAEDAMTNAKATDAQIQYAFRALLTRDPDLQELSVLRRGIERRRGFFENNIDAAERMISQGESEPEQTLDPVELAAMTTCVMTMMNLDETVNRE